MRPQVTAAPEVRAWEIPPSAEEVPTEDSHHFSLRGRRRPRPPRRRRRRRRRHGNSG